MRHLVDPKSVVSFRISLWAALLTVHSVFLAVAYAIILSAKPVTSSTVQVVAWAALFGALLALTCIASIVTEAIEITDSPRDRLSRWLEGLRITKWLVNWRPEFWTWGTVGSIICFFVCAIGSLVLVHGG